MVVVIVVVLCPHYDEKGTTLGFGEKCFLFEGTGFLLECAHTKLLIIAYENN